MTAWFSRSHPWRRRALLTAVVLAETAVVLILAEGGLRAWGYGYSTSPFIEKQCDGNAWHLLNDRYYNQFINLENWPQNNDFPGTTVVREAKPPGTYRVFLFGSSAAYGWFFQDYSMGCILETMLRNKYPHCRFEVITVAFHAMNSFTMRYLADACARMEPDLFLVYMGNNEMIGPYGLQSVLGSKSRSAALMEGMVRVNLWLSNLRLFQLCGIPAQKLFSKSVAHLRWGEYAGVTNIDDPRLERVYRVFRQNLDSICDAASRAGAQTALCTVGYNLKDWRPASAAHRKPLSPADLLVWDINNLFGGLQEEAHAYERAIRDYERAAAIDNTHAGLMHSLGRCYRAVGNYPRARECFLQAVDNGLSFCSANTRINRIIGETASSRSGTGVRLVDTAQALVDNSPEGIPGSEFFYDHVHLTFEGNYVIAAEMFRQTGDLVRKQARNDHGNGPAPPSLEQCMQLMGYSPGVQLRETQTVLSILKNYPANPILPRLESLGSRLEKEVGVNIDSAIAEGDRQALALNDGDMRLRYRYVQCRNGLGQLGEMLDDTRCLVKNTPCSWQYRSAYIWALMGKDKEEALHECQELLALYPEYAGTQELAGNVALSVGDPDQAVDHFRKAVALNGQNAQFHRELGRSLAITGDFRKAVSSMAKAVKLDAAQTGIAIGELRNAVTGFQNAGNWNKTAEGLGAILRMKPDLDEIRPQLAAALCELKDFDAAWNAVAECRKRSITVPQELVARLQRDSGRDH